MPSALRSLWEWMQKERGLLLFAFVLVFIKKWEPGGHIDATWYSAVARNIALSGDFFHFSINPYFVPKLYDHFPLSYWVMGGLMSVFGISDFVARLYFMICSFISLLLLFQLGKLIAGRAFGYAAIFVFALCLGATKWSGAIKHDVPLTMAYLGCTYFFLRGLSKPWLFLWVAPFFAYGVFSKGPVMFGFPLALLGWVVLTLKYGWLARKEFWISFLLLLVLLALPFLPIFHFEGKNYYLVFYEAKKSYLVVGERPDSDYFFYFRDLVLKQPHIFILFLASLVSLFTCKTLFSKEQKQRLLLCGLMVMAILVPLSFFAFKLSYYSLPALPFYAIVSSVAVYAWTKNWDWSKGLFRFSLAAMMIFLAFPLKTTGARHKRVTNVVNQVKFLEDIDVLETYFLGHYDEDMSIFQEFKFYGGVNLRPSTREELTEKDPRQVQVVIRRVDLPVQVGELEVTEAECWMLNEQYCVYRDREKIRLILPDWKWPHEEYRIKGKSEF